MCKEDATCFSVAVFGQQFGSVRVGQMAFFAGDTFFQKPGVGAIDEHLGVVVAFQYEAVGFADGVFHVSGDDAKVCGEYEGFAFAVEGVADGVGGVVGDGKGVDGDAFQREVVSDFPYAAGWEFFA